MQKFATCFLKEPKSQEGENIKTSREFQSLPEKGKNDLEYWITVGLWGMDRIGMMIKEILCDEAIGEGKHVLSKISRAVSIKMTAEDRKLYNIAIVREGLGMV